MSEYLSKNIWKDDRNYLLIIALLVILPHIFVVLAPVNTLLNWFNTDDAFYYYKVAQNIVAGKGITFDGLGLTNGFHPLWLSFLVPVFALAGDDLILPLRLIVGLQTLLSLFSVLLFYTLLRQKVSRWVALVFSLSLVLSTPMHAFINKGGTEAGLNLFALLAFWAGLVWLIPQPLSSVSYTQVLKVGLLALLPLFARLDNAILLAIVGSWLVLAFLWQHWRQKRFRRDTFISALRIGIAYYLPWGGALIVYMLLNRIYIGTFLPVSGLIKRWWGILPYTVYGKPADSIWSAIGGVFSLSNSRGPLALIIAPVTQFKRILINNMGNTVGGYAFLCVLIFFVVIGLWLLWGNRTNVMRMVNQWYLIPLVLGCIAHVGYYLYSGQVALKEWYWVSEDSLLFFVGAILLDSFYHKWRRAKRENLVVVAITMIWVSCLLLPHITRTFRMFDSHLDLNEHFYLARSHWLEANTEPGSLIGMTGAGSTGYFVRERTIVNLDGLISNPTYFYHLQKSSADDYLKQKGLDYVFGNRSIILDSNPYHWIFIDHVIVDCNFEIGDKTLTLWSFH